MRMKEIGIDWNKLQDGAEVELDLDQERQTIHLGNDFLLDQKEGNSDAKQIIFDIVMSQFKDDKHKKK